VNLWNYLKTTLSGFQDGVPLPSLEPSPKALPVPRKPSVRRLELNKRAEAVGHHVALQKGLWALCVTGEQSASRYTYYPTLDELERGIAKLEAERALV